LEDNIEMSHI